MNRRVLIIGLDGATLDVVERLAAAGDLPAMAEMIENGASGRLRAPMPPVTPPSWASFYTAVNPGKHGVFEFSHREKDSYRFVPINSTFLRKPTFWQILSDQGARVGVVNAPLVYPPQPVNGVVLGGFMTPPGARSPSYPSDFMSGLLAEVPSYASWPPELQLGHGNEETYIRTAGELIDAQFDAMEYSMRWLGHWDLFFGAVQFPDQVFHWFWKYDDPGHPLHAAADPRYKGVVRNVHQHLDRRIARMREAAGPDALTIVLSDHGNGPLLRDLYVDTLLADRGWTKFKRTPLTLGKRLLRNVGFTPSAGFRLGHGVGLGGFVRRAMRFKRSTLDRAIATVYISADDVDWSRTSAYAYGTWGNIYLNVAGREPNGLIAADDYESARVEIIEDLRAVADPETGEAIFGEVLSRDDVYQGSELEGSPDIFLVPNDDTVHPVALLPFAEKDWIAAPFSVESGWHRRDGLLLMDGPGVQPGATISGARIEDAGATVLGYMGAGISEDMDGRPIAESFADGTLVTSSRQAAETVVAAAQPYSREEQALIDKRLSELGY